MDRTQEIVQELRQEIADRNKEVALLEIIQAKLLAACEAALEAIDDPGLIGQEPTQRMLNAEAKLRYAIAAAKADPEDTEEYEQPCDDCGEMIYPQHGCENCDSLAEAHAKEQARLTRAASLRP